jgi:putative membrane-bound dehydrogenase-like protein
LSADLLFDPTMKTQRLFLLALAVFSTTALAERIPLFDGKTLNGWDVRPDEEKWWRVQDGAITGGSLEEPVPFNTFIASRKSYENFDLRFKIRMVQGEGFANSGMQVRSIREQGSGMKGYQVDAGVGYWGDLYDEHRRNAKIAGAVDPQALAAVVKDWEWNDYRVLCEGPRIRSWINGEPALDFTEKDPEIPLDGLLGLQAHSGGKFLVQMKDVSIEELPATVGARSWRDGDARTPEEQRQTFVVPEGFEIELVASEEEGVGKPITVTWDAAGRMWTMTALEYPVDANENAQSAEALYARGGKDRVLVFDEPWKNTPQTPRVFAEGLAIPLGILPWKHGVFVQYGHQIRFYEDRDGDGKADAHTPILTGFGIQDSHLFPHQFERSPGGWFYLAQGLFNYSSVARPDGKPFANGQTTIPFNQCKLARTRFDGSAFELLTAGPNNIWGFATARDGREFLQEANDIGHPVSEYIAGTHYPTGSSEKLRPYAPQLPPSTPGQPMGGTGLSGLALAEDEKSPFAAAWPDEKVFYLANPITNRIQIVTQKINAQGHPVYTKREDFLTTNDLWFRPVANHFGPDGCLYIVDWYNKIISHNEVPRTHPDRDKTRGRIWRVRPQGMQPVAPPNLAKLPTVEVVAHLGGPNARIANLAWQELGDRRDAKVLPDLQAIALDGEKPVAQRLGALWALQEMEALDMAFLAKLTRDSQPEVRCQAFHAAGDLKLLSGDEFVSLFPENEADFHVRCAMANALRRQPKANSAMVAAVARLAEGPLTGEGREAYERSFVRYLVRWALESHPAATEAMLRGDIPLPGEARLLAVLALPAKDAAPALLRALPALDRPLVGDEMALLSGQLSQPAVAAAFSELLSDAARREGLLKALLQLDPAAASDPALRQKVGAATTAMVGANSATMPLALEVARRFQLRELASLIQRHASTVSEPAALAVALRTLNEIQAPDVTLAGKYLDHVDAAVAREALFGFASAGGAPAVSEIENRWETLPGALRQIAVDGMVSTAPTAEAFARRIAAGGFAQIDPSVVEKLAAALGAGHPAFKEVLASVKGLTSPSIKLPGQPGAVVALGIDLTGAFTLECWIKLDEGINNRDSLAGARNNSLDMNFWDATLRIHANGQDVAIADRKVAPGVWTHCAVSRDEAGIFTLYLDGEHVATATKPVIGPIQALDLGKANAAGGSAARFIEWRIWNRARASSEIRDQFLTRLPAETEGLMHLVTGAESGLPLAGGATVEWTADFPELLTPEEAKALNAKFERFRGLAAKPGDSAAGRESFAATCMICHKVNGEGFAIGPDLSGAGAMGVESLLRNILTPNAQLESGYYRHDVALNDGGLVSGFLASEDADTVVLRQIGADDRAIRRVDIKEHTVSRRSLMPEGLIDGFSDQQVADLMTYLMTLK